MKQRSELVSRFGLGALLLVLVGLVGTLGFHLLQGWPWFDAFYMTVVTITTVGGEAPTRLTDGGKLWTIVVVTVGFGALTFVLLALIDLVIEGRLTENIGRARQLRRIRKMQGHFILCGFGRVGVEIARALAEEHVTFVIIDSDERSLKRAESEGFAFISGDAAQLDTLKQAGIERARGLITAVDSDADNIYVALSARQVRPNLFIVARANTAEAIPKLRVAGADRVVSPYAIGGRRLASLAVRPTATEFVDTVLTASGGGLLFEDFHIGPDSAWRGRPLGDLVDPNSQAFVLAIKRDGELQFRPPEHTVLAVGDELVAAGPVAAIQELEKRL